MLKVFFERILTSPQTDIQEDHSQVGEEEEIPPSPPPRIIRPLPRGAQRHVSFKGDPKPRYQMTVELQAHSTCLVSALAYALLMLCSEPRRGGRQSLSADSASTTSTSTREFDPTDDDNEPGLAAPSEQSDDDLLAAEMRAAIHISRQGMCTGEQNPDTPEASSSRAATAGSVLSHLAQPDRMESSYFLCQPRSADTYLLVLTDNRISIRR